MNILTQRVKLKGNVKINYIQKIQKFAKSVNENKYINKLTQKLNNIKVKYDIF